VRLVLDTNILISGLLSQKGPPGLLLDLWEEGGSFSLVSAEEQIAELLRVSRYAKMRQRLNPTAVADLVTAMRELTVMAGPLPELDLLPDPNDNFVLAIAQVGRVDLLVTGDKRDLLALRMHAGARIVTAREAIHIRDLIRREQARSGAVADALASLRGDIQEGLNSGSAGPLDVEDIKRRGRERLAAAALRER
jgi:uncharacterized protein